MNAMLNVATILAVALTAIPTVAQSLTWTQLAPASSPIPRTSHAMAYDTTRQRVVLFGGMGGGLLGDTWEWDGFTWLPWTPSMPWVGPSVRYSHAMAYDAARQKVVLFGGTGGGYHGDTWQWDGTNWIQSTPAVSPSARDQHAMAYDAARQRVVLFGGYDGSSVVGDTWEWDGTNWTQLAPASSPSARSTHAMAYDAARQRVVLFGGYGGGGYFGDTWEWDGSTWVPGFSATYPNARGDHAIAYDAARQKVVLFGGGWPALGDTWEWDGTNWMQSTPSVSPSARNGQAMAYDSARQRVVLFGGSGVGFFGDTWVNGPPTTLASATAYGAGCGSPALGFVPDSNGRPLLGQTASATIVNAPTPVAAVAIGASNQFFGPFALPVTLAGIGMPGCDLWQSADILGLGTSPLTPSTLSFSLAIPNAPSLIGLHLYLQAYALAPGVNPLQIIISNGIDWSLGNA